MANRDLDFCRGTKITLPSVYSEALSYYEVLCMLANKIEYLQAQIDDYSDEYKTYTNSAVNSLRIELTNLINNEVTQIENEFNTLVRTVNNTLSAFQIQITALDTKIDIKEISINERTDLLIQQNNEYIFDTIASELISVKVINYFTGEKVTIQDMFYYLCTFHLDDAINYTGLATRAITYTHLADLNIDYTHLVTQGSTLIV